MYIRHSYTLTVGLGEGLIRHTSKPSSQEPEVTELKFHNQGKNSTVGKVFAEPTQKARCAKSL